MEKGISTVLAVMKRRSLPAIAAFVAVIGGAIAYLAVTPSKYEAYARLMLDDKRVSVSELGRDLTQVSANAPGISPLADQAELIKSQRVLERAIAIAFPQTKGDVSQSPVSTAELSYNLKVKNVPATNILELSYQSRDPQLAAKILNAISKAMVEENKEAISLEAKNVRVFLKTKQLPEAENLLKGAEQKEKKYKQDNDIVSVEEQTKSLVQSIAAVEDKERTLSAQLQEIEAKDEDLRKITNTANPNNAYSSVRRGQDDEIKRLRAKLSELDNKLIEARSRGTEENPTVIRLVEERNALDAVLSEQLKRVSPNDQSVSTNNFAGDQLSQDLNSKLVLNNIEKSAVSKSLKDLQDKKKDLQRRLEELPRKQQELTVLTREREAAAASLKFLQGKLEQAQLTEAQQVSNIREIEKAVVPSSPSEPKQKVILALASVFGSMLAVGIVLLLEVMDNTLRDAAEAEELLQLSLLGILPRLPGKTLVLEPASRFLDNMDLVEPYRTLFKTLEFRSSKQLRVIVVSSTISGEGKSVVASHLAAVAGMLSWRTLMIDADLRRPTQHTLFNIAPGPGMTEVLEGNVSLLDAVQPTDIENLDVLTCGELHGRPSQLLESIAMKSLMAEAAENYDLVIIDTPPLTACADAATLAQEGDGVMLITRPGFTDKEVLSRCVWDLTQNRIPILGVVVNGMTQLTPQKYRYPIPGYQPRLPKPAKQLIGAGENAKNYGNRMRHK
ncbi:polysaccharide biosynthesis tyrosine autokinase [Brasilonema sp. UFV-L1]|uniref:GumC family protein n=1 Tax=Brasilonema sp. UFV-L1 TaxID=2234130 RepID=UPI00145FACB1|nr:polysaccharide biosynthesis tyrosine autokinase [Brasilonema sp. UFV-L1]NMG08961.1 chain-length determining protein [Brasilonema sp. UFV-L1]